MMRSQSEDRLDMLMWNVSASTLLVESMVLAADVSLGAKRMVVSVKAAGNSATGTEGKDGWAGYLVFCQW